MRERRNSSKRKFSLFWIWVVITGARSGKIENIGHVPLKAWYWSLYFYDVEQDPRSKGFLMINPATFEDEWMTFSEIALKRKTIRLKDFLENLFHEMICGGWLAAPTWPPSCTRTEVWFLATTVLMAEEEVGRRIKKGRRIVKVILIILVIFTEEEVGRRRGRRIRGVILI